MFFRKEENLIDNYGKECRPLNKRIEHGGWTYAANCSLCGGYITLWPCFDEKCSKCGAKVVDER